MILGYFVYAKWWMPAHATADVFGLLESKGYTPNPGFSGLFRPGNLIQVTELGAAEKEQPIPTPLLFAWGDECFPGRVPRSQEFTLPQGTGSFAASLNVGRETTARLLPSLNLRSEAVADYSLALENTRVLVFAKGDLSGGFSRECVSKLQRAIRAGDKIEWFRLILASVVADAVTLHIRWKDSSAADARNELAGIAKNTLAQTVATGSHTNGSDVKIGITNQSTRDTTISARGLVIIGYQARPMQPETNPAVTAEQ